MTTSNGLLAFFLYLSLFLKFSLTSVTNCPIQPQIPNLTNQSSPWPVKIYNNHARRVCISWSASRLLTTVMREARVELKADETEWQQKQRKKNKLSSSGSPKIAIKNAMYVITCPEWPLVHNCHFDSWSLEVIMYKLDCNFVNKTQNYRVILTNEHPDYLQWPLGKSDSAI